MVTILQPMKKMVWVFLMMAVVMVPGAWGAGEDAARAAADRAAAEERYRILQSSIDDLVSSQREFRRRLDAVSEALQKVSREVNAKPDNSRVVTREEFEKLVESVREIDRKREADRRQILEQIEDLGKSLQEMLKRPAVVPPTAKSQPRGNQEGVEYVVEAGNTLSSIISAHNAAFKEKGRKTSLQLILDANPGLKPTTMQVGRKLFIPMVPVD